MTRCQTPTHARTGGGVPGGIDKCVNCFIVRHTSIGARKYSFGTFDTYNSRSEGTRKLFHVLDHNLNDTLN